MDQDSWGSFGDAPPDTSATDVIDNVEVPVSYDYLPDGRETVVVGDVAGLAELSHKQGDNPYGFEQTCGLVSCEDVLGQFGVEVTEADMVEHAVANGQCEVTDPAEASGGTNAATRDALLADHGIPAHVENGQSLEDLATDVEQGSGVIISANAGVLWDDANAYDNGQANHAVVVTGVARDPGTGEIQGFYINDSGTGEAGVFVDADTMQVAYVETGGTANVTDIVRSGSEEA